MIGLNLEFLLPSKTAMKAITILFAVLFGFFGRLSAQQPIKMEWSVSGIKRNALVYVPSGKSSIPRPIIFLFHGHGGSMENVFYSRRFDMLWPEAIFVCPQGLNTVSALVDPKGEFPGWLLQTENNRDIDFLDSMLITFRRNYQIDTKRIYATGHSNGGAFCYVLWATRPEVFAAFAPTATTAAGLVGKLKPKPAFHLIGESDSIVKPSWQMLTTTAVRKLNNCEAVGRKLNNFSTFFSSKTGTPFTLFSHSGGHNYPKEANDAIIKFFKEN